MQKTIITLTIFFSDPFWVGAYERISDGKLEVCKITFGAEPKDYEVYDFLLQNWHKLRFSPPVKSNNKQDIKVNPKRMQRLINKQLKPAELGTRSQQALKLQHEENKIVRERRVREKKEEKKNYQYELRQRKKKEKHKGR